MTTTETRGDGIAVLTEAQLAKIENDDLRKYVHEAQRVAASAAYNINERRFASEETRFTIWEGQSPDGRKHADANDGRPAFPFEGASDARIRLADMIVNERVLILAAAALRNLPKVKGLQIDQEGLGHKLTTLLKWVIRNKLGSEYVRTILKLAQYQEADSPAGAMLGVWWEQETALEMRDLTLQDIGQTLVQTFGLDPKDVQRLQVELMNPDRDSDTAESLTQLLPHLKPARAKRMVKELRETQKTTYPAPYLRLDRPCLRAYRLYQDIFFPTNTAGDVQRGRCYFIREWLSEVELRERIVSDGYDEEFVDECLKHEGATGWPLYRRNPTQGDFMVIKQEESNEAYRGLYEINTVMFKAVNEDNVPGLYYMPFHFQVEIPGHERKLLEYEHGEYPLVYFTREILGDRLLDSRGVPELVSTEQSGLKLLCDSFNDNVSLATVPPIKVPRRRTRLSLVIGPLKVIKEDRPGDVSWMEPPQYPIGNEKQQELVRRRVDEYFGRISEAVPPMLTQLHQTGMVMLFLSSLSDGLNQLIQLCQQYMDDDELTMITGDDGIPIARSREDIQGKFQVELTFDPRDLDMEYLKTIAEIIVKVILPADTLNTVQRDKLVQRLFMAIDPNLAAETLRPVEDASQSEVKDESVNFARIAAGDEPEMVAEGQNFPLRLQVLMGIAQKNPEAIQALNPTSKKIWEARVKYLQNQVQQLKNAQIGRQVGQPALSSAATAPGGPGAPGGNGAGISAAGAAGI